MTAKKQKEKDRRRARKLADEAWEAAHQENLDLAVKIIRRAVAAQPDNPVLWNDQGVLLGLQRREADAEASFRSAIGLAPDFAEPYVQLAALRIKQGFVREAIRLQEQAVKLAPQNAAYANRLDGYRLLEHGEDTELIAPTMSAPASALDRKSMTLGEGWLAELSQREWPTLNDVLTRTGCALLPHLLDAKICSSLAGLFDDDSLFAKTVVMDRPNFGLGTYRYFRAPLPPVVDDLRRAVYPHAARIANGWQQLLREPRRYAQEWDDFREECRLGGQTTPTPILLKYGPGGFNALHRDIRGAVFFPIQLAVVLSPQVNIDDPNAGGFTGGEFQFCDVPERAKSRRRFISAGLGDGLLFCTRDRLAPVGGVYGLLPVKHGVAPITSGIRFVLGVPFHEYR